MSVTSMTRDNNSKCGGRGNAQLNKLAYGFEIPFLPKETKTGENGCRLSIVQNACSRSLVPFCFFRQEDLKRDVFLRLKIVF